MGRLPKAQRLSGGSRAFGNTASADRSIDGPVNRSTATDGRERDSRGNTTPAPPQNGGHCSGAGGINGAAVATEEDDDVLQSFCFPDTIYFSDAINYARKNKRKWMNDKQQPGAVVSIELSNFMCHRLLSVSFCRQVNFINGPNGSGKSAILAALQICLGAEAHHTHRAETMADFIRHGCKGDAVVEVTLLNTMNGFKFDDYGDSITVRRTIKPNGGGGFALLGHDGMVKSSGKAELLSMLDMLNIKVDNPFVVLDQESMKTVLSGDEEEMFRSFTDAMEIDRVHQKFAEGSEREHKLREDLRAAQDDLMKLGPDLRRLRKELGAIDMFVGSEEWTFNLKEKIVWATVDSDEKDLADVAKSITRERSVIDSLTDDITGWQQDITDIVSVREAAEARSEATAAEAQRLKEVVIDRRGTLLDAQASLSRLETAQTLFETEREDSTAEKTRLSEALRVAREAAGGAVSSEGDDELEEMLSKHLCQTNGLLTKVLELQRQRGGVHTIDRLREAISKAEADARRTKDTSRRFKDELEAQEAETARLQTEAFDPLLAFGGHMPALVNEINKHARKFRNLPVGPIGAYIQLKEEYKEFRICIEAHLSKNLSDFVVSCDSDMKMLADIIEEFRRERSSGPLPNIVVQTPQARYKPPHYSRSFPQMMQAIDVTNDQVFNCLVDQCSIENACVFSSKEAAELACLRRASREHQLLPHGTFEAYYLCSNQSGVVEECGKANISDGDLQLRTNVSRGIRRVLDVDEGILQQEAQQRVDDAKTALVEANEMDGVAATALDGARKALRREEAERRWLDDEADKLTRETQRTTGKLTTIQAARSVTPNRIRDLELELRAEEQGLDEATRKVNANSNLVLEGKAAVQALSRAKKEAEQAYKDYLATSQVIVNTDPDTGRGQRSLEKRIAEARSHIVQVNERLSSLWKKRQAAEERVTQAVTLANAAMERLRRKQGIAWDGRRVSNPGGRCPAELQAKLAKRKELHEKEKVGRDRSGRTKETVVAELEKAAAFVVEARAKVEALDNKLRMVVKKRVQGLKRWKRVQDYAAKRTCRLFHQYLQEVGALGYLAFDMAYERLTVTYDTNASDALNDVFEDHDVRHRSRGEKSQATLALLRAIGELDLCPFRVVDGFDMSMDAVSRSIAIRQISLGWSNSSKQFIFVTPQDLSSVYESAYCKIISLAPPRRRGHDQPRVEV